MRRPAWCVSPRSCRSGMSAVRSLTGVDRKWLADRQSEAIDPQQKFSRFSDFRKDCALLPTCSYSLARQPPIRVWGCHNLSKYRNGFNARELGAGNCILGSDGGWPLQNIIYDKLR